MAASEQSSLLMHSHSHPTFPNLAYPGNSTNNSDNTKGQYASLVEPKSNGAIGEGRSLEEGVQQDDHIRRYRSLTTSDPKEILFALERAADFLRGQVEEEDEQRSTNSRRKPLLPAWLTNHLLLITFLIQVVGVGVLEIFHAVGGLNGTPNGTNEVDEIIVYSGDGVLCLIEAVHLAVVVVVSFKLVKQVLHHTASGVFLAQCYLSTVLLFAGLYTLEFRIKDSAWDNVHSDYSTHPTVVYLRMLYFSVSTATLCGTSTVEPLLWFSFLTVGVQMLLSFVYFASILSISIVPRKASKFKNTGRPRSERSFTKTIRKCFIFLCCCRSWTANL